MLWMVTFASCLLVCLSVGHLTIDLFVGTMRRPLLLLLLLLLLLFQKMLDVHDYFSLSLEASKVFLPFIV